MKTWKLAEVIELGINKTEKNNSKPGEEKSNGTCTYYTQGKSFPVVCSVDPNGKCKANGQPCPYADPIDQTDATS